MYKKIKYLGNMKKQLFSLLFTILLPTSMMAQSFVSLSFTGRDADNKRIQLDRVVITNLTRDWQETLYWPDTILTMQNETGIYDVETMCTSSLQLFQNNPNPFNGTTNVNLTVADAGTVALEIADMNGHVVETRRMRLQCGTHQFRVTLSATGTYVMTALQNGQMSSIKMVNNGGGNGDRIEYAGEFVKTTHALSPQPKSGTRGNTSNLFDNDDMMEYVGYATIDSTEKESRHILKAQRRSQLFVLPFSDAEMDGQPCPGTPTLTDIDGNVYNTVQMGSQCWMKENLKTTRFHDETVIPLNDSINTSYTAPFRYAPNGNASNVPTYGYLYSWAAVMHGTPSSATNPSNVQGICPTGWHVPSDAEWLQLIDYVGSQSAYVCGTSNTHIAKALADSTNWDCTCELGLTIYDCAVCDDTTSNNATGFSILPAGIHDIDYSSFAMGKDSGFWCSTQYEDPDYAWNYGLTYNYAGVCQQQYCDKFWGLSVRCVRD